jgi:hypothetical protein
VEWVKLGPEFKPQYCKEKQKTKTKTLKRQMYDSGTSSCIFWVETHIHTHTY